jgi:hypothetical protein
MCQAARTCPIVPRQIDAQIVDYRLRRRKRAHLSDGGDPQDQRPVALRRPGHRARPATSITYELPAEHSASEAFTATREALQQAGRELLFWCQARDCGESSLWANEVFGNAKLVVPTATGVSAAASGAPKDNTLVALYSITRGNRRAYLHVEQFDASAPLGELLPTSATLLRELKSTGELDFPKLTEPDEPG